MKIEITLPNWLLTELDKLPEAMPVLDERMATVIRLSRMNFENETGGPFAAGIFERETGRVVALGVNRVIPCNNSCAHAEIVAISLAQQKLGVFDLGGQGQPAHQLVVNARPCAMCFGSIPWSGVRSLVVGAAGELTESLTGFDEGPVHPDWQSELRKRNIEVIEDILSEQASQILRDFGQSGQIVYNGRMGSS